MGIVPEPIYLWARMRSRKKKARIVREFIEARQIDSVLFVGVGQGWQPLDLVVEQAAANTASMAVACDLHEDHNVPWPYVRADGTALPFSDKSFDLVLSNAVIEHVGQREDQQRLVDEQVRVGRHVCVTTPNRWFPFEPHKKVFFRHWSGRWRARQRDAFTRLLSQRELMELMPADSHVVGGSWSPTFTVFWPHDRTPG